MTAFFHHFLFEFRTGLRDRNLLLMNYLFPLGFFALMGVLMTQINPGFKETMVPAMVVFAFLSSAVLALPGPLVAARDGGIFRSYRINGVPAVSILLIPAVSTTLHMVLVAAAIVICGPLLFGARMPVDAFGSVLTFLAIAVACTGLGVLVGVIASDSRAIVLWSQLVFLPSMLLGGLIVPVSMLPPTLARVAWLLPSTQADERVQRPGARAAGGPPADGIDRNPPGRRGACLRGGNLPFQVGQPERYPSRAPGDGSPGRAALCGRNDPLRRMREGQN